MKIELHTIPIRDLVEGFEDNNEKGIVGYGGKLNIRPPYQREFVYKDKQRDEVINSIFKEFPLNVMYWVENEQGTYELLDGQQRTLSICMYHENAFFVDVDGTLKTFSNLNKDEENRFMDYSLQIYICKDGTDTEKLNWFKIINIAGETLTDQEMRNAVYTGPWITAAKLKFSKSTCVARRLGERYMSGSPIRQDYLQTVLKWISNNNIEQYMGLHQHDDNADREWQYFQNVIHWIENIYPKYRKEMKGLPWGDYYNHYKENYYPATKMEEEVTRLMMDDDVTNKKGIYEYLLSNDESKLNIRVFTDNMKREAYERQEGICISCHQHFEIEEMEGDHITPWSQGGKTTADNCQMLCKHCNRIKSNK